MTPTERARELAAARAHLEGKRSAGTVTEIDERIAALLAEHERFTWGLDTGGGGLAGVGVLAGTAEVCAPPASAKAAR